MHRRWIGFAVAAVAIAASVLAWPDLPQRVATHWDLAGRPNGYSAKWLAVSMVPAMIVALRGLAEVLPRIDPKWANYPRFFDTYWLIINGILILLGVVHLLMIASGLGWTVPVGRLLPLGVGALMIVLGNFLTRVQSNWFMGIRTPWTLSSDRVWRKTHRLGGRLFVLGGLGLCVLGFLPKSVVIPGFVAIMVVVVVIPIAASYVFWRKEQRDGMA